MVLMQVRYRLTCVGVKHQVRGTRQYRWLEEPSGSTRLWGRPEQAPGGIWTRRDISGTEGWDATGFDRSSGGVALALENAQKAGVTINAIASDAADFDWGEERFDFISNIHSFGLHESLSKIRTALKTGGIYVVELSMLPEMQLRARYPVSYLPNEPLSFFRDGWRILRYEDVGGPWDCVGCVNNPKSRVLEWWLRRLIPPISAEIERQRGGIWRFPAAPNSTSRL